MKGGGTLSGSHPFFVAKLFFFLPVQVFCCCYFVLSGGGGPAEYPLLVAKGGL